MLERIKVLIEESRVKDFEKEKLIQDYNKEKEIYSKRLSQYTTESDKYSSEMKRLHDSYKEKEITLNNKIKALIEEGKVKDIEKEKIVQEYNKEKEVYNKRITKFTTESEKNLLDIKALNDFYKEKELTMNNKIKVLMEELKLKENEKEKLLQDIYREKDVLKQRHSQFSSESENQTQDLKRLSFSINEKESLYSNKIAQLSNELSLREIEKQTLLKDKNSLTEKLNKLIYQCNSKDSEKDAILEKMQTLVQQSKNWEEKEDAFSKLKKDNEILQDKIKSFNDKEKLKDIISECNNDCIKEKDSIKMKLTMLIDELESKETKLIECTKEVDRITILLNQKTKSLDDLQNEFDKLRQVIQEQKALENRILYSESKDNDATALGPNSISQLMDNLNQSEDQNPSKNKESSTMNKENSNMNITILFEQLKQNVKSY